MFEVESDRMPSLDVRIDHARVYTGDSPGSDAAPFPPGPMRSVGIAGDRVALNVNPATPAKRSIDATGLALSPGWIDPFDQAGCDAACGFTTKLAAMQPIGDSIDACMEVAERQSAAAHRGLLVTTATLGGCGSSGLTRSQTKMMQREMERAMRLGYFGLAVERVESSELELLGELAEVVAAHDGVLVGRSPEQAATIDRISRRTGARQFTAPTDGSSATAAGVDLETMIHRLTGEPAELLRLTDRGRLRQNAAADLVLFDADPFDAPDRGVRWVFVNGQAVVSCNSRTKPRVTEARPGKLLRFKP